MFTQMKVHISETKYDVTRTGKQALSADNTWDNWNISYSQLKRFVVYRIESEANIEGHTFFKTWV